MLESYKVIVDFTKAVLTGQIPVEGIIDVVMVMNIYELGLFVFLLIGAAIGAAIGVIVAFSIVIDIVKSWYTNYLEENSIF